MSIVNLHRFIDGPYATDAGMWFSLCLIEDTDGDVVISEIGFKTLDDALEVKETLTTTLYALEIEADECSTTTLN